MELARLYSAILSRKWWLIASTSGFAALAVAWHFLVPAKFTARASVFLDLAALSTPPGAPSTGTQATTFSQIEIASSEKVLMDAVAHLAEKHATALLGSSGPIDSDRLLGALRQAVMVTVGRDSTVLQINATTRDAEASAAIANAVATAYLGVSNSLKTAPLRFKAETYQANLSELQSAALDAQEQVTAFQLRTGLVNSGLDRADPEQAVLSELIRRTSELRAQYIGSAAGRAEVGAGANAEVLKSSVVQALQIDIARARGRIEELDGRLGRSHPQYQSAVRELAELERSLATETALASGSVAQSARADTRSADRLSQVVDRQKALVVDLTAKRGQLAELQDKAAYARKSLEAMRDRLATALIDIRAAAGGTGLLQGAQPPRETSDAPLKRTLPLAAFFGFALAGFSIAVAERRRPRLRATTDALAIGTRLIALIPLAAGASVEDRRTLEFTRSIQSMGPDERRLGALLVAAGKLTEASAQQVHEEQLRNGLPFGALAVQMGVLKPDDVLEALSTQYGMRRVTSDLRGDHTPEQFVVDQHPAHPVAEAVRALRTHLLLSAERSPGANVIAVTSPDRGDGKSFVAANLAIAFSQAGQRTLLVEADLRDPQLAIRFGSSRKEGLSSFLAGLVSDVPIFALDASQMLSLMPSGPRPPNPQELLSHPAFATVLARASADFDMVIVDTPAACIGSDAKIIAVRAGRAVVIGKWNESGLGPMKDLVANLTEAGVEVAGMVVNRFTS